jgi:hemerythrin-like domain-containing protein
MNENNRRHFLVGAAGAGLLLAGCKKDEDVAPPEDLMREHGLLNRVLLIYDESVHRLETKAALPVETLVKSATIIRQFIEQYHEKLEEDYLFPRFEKANKLVDLVATLRRQHEAGRVLTESILRLSTAASIAKDDDRARLIANLRSFNRMYRPHEAREDTELFPALRSVVSAHEFHELGEKFEDKEHELFGKAGFEGIVPQVADLERSLGINDLNQFTPSPP